MALSMPTSDNVIGGSFSIGVIKRILNLLTDCGSAKKTNLAGKAGLNYPTCIKYIEFLKLLGWVKVSVDGSNHVYSTELGRRFTRVLSGDPSALMEIYDNSKDTSSMPTTANSNSKLGSFLANSIGAEVMDKGLALGLPNGETKQQQNEGNNDAQSSKPIMNIMLVDDEPDVLLTYKLQLAQEGYNVDCFVDPKSAIHSFRSVGLGYYDLVITDIRMKNINGIQLYQGIKSFSPSTKVMFVSALDAAEELLSLLPGVTSRDIIRKPVEQALFLKHVKEAITNAEHNENNNSTKSVLTHYGI